MNERRIKRISSVAAGVVLMGSLLAGLSSSRSEGKLDYTWVDRMSAFNVAADEIAKFRAQGHLPGGAQ